MGAPEWKRLRVVEIGVRHPVLCRGSRFRASVGDMPPRTLAGEPPTASRPRPVLRWALIGSAAAVVIALLLGALWPFLPHPLRTDQGSVQELYEAANLAHVGADSTHVDVNAEYELAASIWPWDLPPGFVFSAERGAPDTPGHHWVGMGVRAAFQRWASATLSTVQSEKLPDGDKTRLLDQVAAATDYLLDLRILSDVNFVANSVDPLRP